MTFTDKKPTVPGAYAIQLESGEEDLVRVYEAKRTSKLEFEGVNTWGGVEDKGILWSSRLVPVEEVRLAYAEGQHHEYTGDDYEHSRARRVVEGKETL